MTNQQTASRYSPPSNSTDELPNIGSYSDLTKELRNKNALLIRFEEKIMDLDLEDLSVGELKKIEKDITKQAKRSLALCKALNQNVWVGVGISEKQHEESGQKVRELMKEFKSIKNEVSVERKQKQTAQKFNLTEVNAAMAIAPFATYGFLNVFFPEMSALSKGAAIIVFASEAVYVIYKRNPEQWRKVGKEIAAKGLISLANSDPEKIKHFFSSIAGEVRQRGKKVFAQPVKKAEKVAYKSLNDNSPK